MYIEIQIQTWLVNLCFRILRRDKELTLNPAHCPSIFFFRFVIAHMFSHDLAVISSTNI